MTHRRPAFVVQTLGVKTNFPTAPRQFIYPKCESWAKHLRGAIWEIRVVIDNAQRNLIVG